MILISTEIILLRLGKVFTLTSTFSKDFNIFGLSKLDKEGMAMIISVIPLSITIFTMRFGL